MPITGSYEWVLPGLIRSKEKINSPIFRIGGYAWHLRCLPQGEDDHVGFYLCYYRAYRVPPGSPHCPDTAFTLTIKNHKNSNKADVQKLHNTFSSTQDDWGCRTYIKRERLTLEGFLAKDGSLTIRLDLTVYNPRESCCLHTDPVGASNADFLALLEDPGATSDLTIMVGGGNGSAAGGNASGSAGSSGGATTPSGSGQPQQSFRVHRAVLAARCPFFRTLFNAGMADSTARELPLPDADPDAFAVLLRYLYGGEVPPCERAVHRASVPLCDTLLLPKVKEALEEELVETADASTIVGDLLWAAQGGQEGIVDELLGVYKQVAKDVDPAQAVAMAVANPQLAGRIIVELSAGETVAAAADKDSRKRARTEGAGAVV